MSREPHARPVLDEPDEEGLASLLLGMAALVIVFLVAFVLLPLAGVGQP